MNKHRVYYDSTYELWVVDTYEGVPAGFPLLCVPDEDSEVITVVMPGMGATLAALPVTEVYSDEGYTTQYSDLATFKTTCKELFK